jgi:FixJ family two-component response regulator
MPGTRGIDLLEGLRGAGWTTPVLLMTAFVDPTLRSRTELAGGALVIEKPFDLAQPRDAVFHALSFSAIPGVRPER